MIRRARTLVIKFEGEQMLALNYLTKMSCKLSTVSAAILAASADWVDPLDLYVKLPAQVHQSLAVELSRLVTNSIIVQAGTAQGEDDQRFERHFLWGDSVGYYHFTIRNTVYMSPLQFSGWIAQQVEATATVPLYSDHALVSNAITLPRPNDTLDGYSSMRSRRSYRGFSDQPLSLAQLSDCLFAGLGIIGFVEGSAVGEGYLPFSMTPSGGGRNPYEAYVYAPNVEELAAGTYHYSARDHSLVLVNGEHLPRPGDVVGGQPWFDNAAALILLVADFQRTMWKYPHPTGYRVVVLEAGHIAQNIILTASAHGLACAPTCALADGEAEKLTRMDSITQTTMYSVALGQRSRTPTAVDPLRIVPNELAAWHDRSSSAQTHERKPISSLSRNSS